MIIKKPCTNFGSRNGFKSEFVSIHIMDGTLVGTDSWFATPSSQVSSHYGIGLNGEIHQYVDESNAAWANGRVSNPTTKAIHLNINPNQYSISIEHEGKDLALWTDAQLKVSADLVKDICARHKIPIDENHIVFHKEIYSLKPYCPTPNPTFKTRYMSLLKGSDKLSPPPKEDIKKQIIELLNKL